MIRTQYILFSLLTLGCVEQADRGVALREALSQAREAARAQPITPRSIHNAAGVRALLARDFSTSVALLGGVIYTVVHVANVLDEANESQGNFAEATTLMVSATGDFGLSQDLNWGLGDDGNGGDGRRCWRVGEGYYTSGRFGHARRLPVVAHEDRQCLRSGLDPLTTLLDRTLDQLTLTATEGESILGRATVRLEGVFEGEAQIPKALPRAYRRRRDPDLESPAIFGGPRRPLLFDYTDLREATVSLRFDAQTGLPLQAKILLKFAVRKLGHDGTLAVRYELISAKLKGSILAPKSFDVWAPRARPFRDQAALLGPLKPAPDAALPQPGEAPTLELTVDEAELEKQADTPREDP